jgi:hypothetical protein
MCTNLVHEDFESEAGVDFVGQLDGFRQAAQRVLVRLVLWGGIGGWVRVRGVGVLDQSGERERERKC